MDFEKSVRKYYDDTLVCYEGVLGDRWHFGDPDAKRAGVSLTRACEVMEEKVLELARLKDGDRVLDFGSGIGGPTLYMAMLSSAYFVGVCNNEHLTKRAIEKATQQGLADRVAFQVLGDTEYKNLPFPEASFDAVTFYDSVCHLMDKQAFFNEAFRVLKPGGRLVGIDWLQRPFGEYQTDEQIMKFMGPVNESICIPWHGTVEKYREMMLVAGFEVLRAIDLYEGVYCVGDVPDIENEEWTGQDTPIAPIFLAGKQSFDAACLAGVFTEGQFVGMKPQ